MDHNRGYEPGNVRWMTRREQDHPNQTELPLRFDAVQLLLPLEGFAFRSPRPSFNSPSIAPHTSDPSASMASLAGAGRMPSQTSGALF
jgi:hypothetical protein